MGPDDMAIGRGEVTPELLALLLEVRGEFAISASEVAEILEISSQNAEQQLRRLAERDQIDCRRSNRGDSLWGVKRRGS